MYPSPARYCFGQSHQLGLPAERNEIRILLGQKVYAHSHIYTSYAAVETVI